MVWQIEWVDAAKKDFSKLGHNTQMQIYRYLQERVLTGNPRDQGKPLAGRLAGLWRYRVGDYRVLCRIKNSEVTILIVAVGHRSVIYDA